MILRFGVACGYTDRDVIPDLRSMKKALTNRRGTRSQGAAQQMAL